MLGGMGPEATLHLFKLIIKNTPAKIDQEHIPILIWNNPHIPDRTKFIIEKGEDPLPHLIEGAKKLENSGADFLVMPCITAHYFYEKILKEIKIPFLHIIRETIEHQKNRFPGLKKIGILASTGTVRTGLFQKFFKKEGIEIITPDANDQNNLIMKAIYGDKGVKAGYKILPKKLLIEAGNNLIKKGAEALISGCTEVPLLLTKNVFNVPLLDPLIVLAKSSVKFSFS
ncbi:MAG: amino acid racemase [Acidobacteriota bacterium]